VAYVPVDPTERGGEHERCAAELGPSSVVVGAEAGGGPRHDKVVCLMSSSSSMAADARRR
jgi:hypothetical protein